MEKIRFFMPALAIVTMVMFCSCETKNDANKKLGIAEKYPNVQIDEINAVSINGESLRVQWAVVNDTLIAITVEKSDAEYDKNISMAQIFAKDPKAIQKHTPEGGLVLECDESKTWIFYATLGSPTEEQAEPQTTDYHPTTFVVISDYIDYNGAIYKHE